MISYYKILFISFFSLIVFIIIKYEPKNKKYNANDKQTLLLFLFFFYFYSGIGASYKNVSTDFLYIYIISLISFFTSYLVSRRVFKKIVFFNRPAKKLYNWLDKISIFFLIFYFIILIFPLLYPSFRLPLIFSPPMPNLSDYFDQRLEHSEKNILLHLVSFLKLLLTPLYFITISKYLKKTLLLFLLLFIPLYVEYVNVAYIGRGKVLSAAMLFILVYWYDNPTKRIAIIIGASISLPFLLYLFFLYTYMRHGGSIDVSVFDAGSLVLESETGFIQNAGNALLEKNVFADVTKYLKWTMTLFLPIGFFYKIDQIELNFEMSSHILGYSYGSGWYVNLPGPLAESVYIYGSYFSGCTLLFLGYLLLS